MIHPNAHRAGRAVGRAGGNASSGEIVDARVAHDLDGEGLSPVSDRLLAQSDRA